MEKYIIAIDQSTAGTKALLIDERGCIIHKNSKSHLQISPFQGWIEHDPLEIYHNVKELIREMAEFLKGSSDQFQVLSLTNQRETVVIWDRETGEPAYNAIVWQCKRTIGACESLKMKGHEETIRSKTGLTIDPYFSASKASWIINNVEGLRKTEKQKKLLMGTMDSWLMWKLTKGKVHATDYTNASRTLLFNIHTLDWDDDLLGIFRIPRHMLPEIKGSDDIYGFVEDEQCNVGRVPISGIIGDSQGALFGQKCFNAGLAKATYGTGTSVMMHTGECIEGRKGLVTTIAWGRNGEVDYALEGIINSTGDVIKWIKEDLELVSAFTEVEGLAESLNDNGGVYLVPSLVGLGAPYWSPETKAAIVGMNRSTKRAHIVRAALESIAYQVKDIIELMEKESGMTLAEFKVDGGASTNRFLMQFQADLIERDVCVSKVPELSALGSVYLAGLATGFWKSIDDILKINHENVCYYPSMEHQLMTKHYDEWKKAVASVLV